MTRDVTAWACSFALASACASGIGPILIGKRLRAWARLGPLSRKHALRYAFHRRFPTLIASALAQQGGMAVSRLDGRGVSLSRTLFLGSAWPLLAITGPPWPGVGPMLLVTEDSLFTSQQAPRAAILTRLAF